MDTSYVGRGNGKSAFIVYLQEQINQDYCLDISKEQNKCFAIRVLPESGGRTKTFESFIDIIIETRDAVHVISESIPFIKNNTPATIKAALGDFFASFIT